MALADDSASQRALDRRFEQSLRVVRAAISRRQAWKSEKLETVKN
jgi:hypothetical protein